VSLARKVKRAQERKLKKEMKQKAKAIATKMSGMPKNCDECNAPFDRSNKELLNEWRIAVYDDGPIHLVCPDCVPDDIKKS